VGVNDSISRVNRMLSTGATVDFNLLYITPSFPAEPLFWISPIVLRWLHLATEDGFVAGGKGFKRLSQAPEACDPKKSGRNYNLGTVTPGLPSGIPEAIRIAEDKLATFLSSDPLHNKLSRKRPITKAINPKPSILKNKKNRDESSGNPFQVQQ